MSDTAPPSPSAWPGRFGLAGIASALIAVIGAYGSGFGFWHFTTGFMLIAVALFIAIIALIGGGISLRRGARDWWLATGMAAALALVATIGLQIWHGSQVPPIHEVTTDLANDIQFGDLPGRTDRFAGLSGGRAEWQRLHRAAYGDIQPVRLPGTRDAIMPRVQEIVRARGWAVAYADAQRIEATETVSPFRFKDDIIIVATPEADGTVTRIDIRSVSRVGVSDLGVNARRVRALIADIRALED